ncbi:MAG: Crp/Fnr family transcriptional regulator [Candidatus Aminicenantaceae bacterium]
MKDLLTDIKKLGRIQAFGKDEILFNAGDSANGFYYVQSGEVRIFRMDYQGKEVEVVRLNPGDFFGEAVVFVADKFPAFAQAVMNTKTLFFSKNTIFQHIDKDPSIARFFISLLARKCIVLNKRIETLELRTVRQRLAQFILSQYQEQKSEVIVLNMKKVELARSIGTISETLSRCLKQMQEDNLIEVHGREIRVKDSVKLKQELL